VPAKVESVFCETKRRDAWETDIENYAKLLIRFANDVLYQVEIGNLATVPIPRWYVLGDKGGLCKYGLDPQEGPMREGRIEEAQEAPEDRARVVTYARGKREELVLDSVRGTWKSFYRNISDVLNEGAELAIQPAEVLRVMRVYDAAMESAASAQVVFL
jgi:scyllo-inositol 2-dehydrogenase (NADP+)